MARSGDRDPPGQTLTPMRYPDGRGALATFGAKANEDTDYSDTGKVARRLPRRQAGRGARRDRRCGGGRSAITSSPSIRQATAIIPGGLCCAAARGRPEGAAVSQQVTGEPALRRGEQPQTSSGSPPRFASISRPPYSTRRISTSESSTRKSSVTRRSKPMMRTPRPRSRVHGRRRRRKSAQGSRQTESASRAEKIGVAPRPRRSASSAEIRQVR